MSFVHLRSHTVYSLLDGMGQPKDYVDLAKKFGQPAVAITDAGNLFASYMFWKECNAQKIKPILGIEFFMAESDNMKTKDGPRQLRVVALAKNVAGWQNLMALSTLSYLEGRYYKPRIDSKTLFQHSEGLIVLSTGLNGQIGSLFKKGNELGAMDMARKYRDVFGEDFYLEVSAQSFYEQIELNKFFLKIASMDGFQLVATNNCRYPRQDQGQYYEYLLLMQNGVKESDARRKEIPEDYFFKTRLEMFDSLKEQNFDQVLISSWLDRTLAIADKIEPLEFKIDFKLPKFNTEPVDVVVPQGGIITGFTTEDEEDEDDDAIDAEFSVQMELTNTKD